MSYFYFGSFETEECEMCIDTDPQNTFGGFVQNFIHKHL